MTASTWPVRRPFSRASLDSKDVGSRPLLAAYSSPVVCVCTPIFLPFAPARFGMSLPLRDQERLRRVEVGVGEVDVLLPLGGDRDARCRHVALAGVEERARLEVLEGGVEERLLGPQLLGRLVDDVDVEPDDLAVLLELERRVRQVGAGGQHPCLGQPGGAAAGCCSEPPPDPPHAARTQLDGHQGEQGQAASDHGIRLVRRCGLAPQDGPRGGDPAGLGQADWWT